MKNVWIALGGLCFVASVAVACSDSKVDTNQFDNAVPGNGGTTGGGGFPASTGGAAPTSGSAGTTTGGGGFVSGTGGTSQMGSCVDQPGVDDDQDGPRRRATATTATRA